VRALEIRGGERTIRTAIKSIFPLQGVPVIFNVKRMFKNYKCFKNDMITAFIFVLINPGSKNQFLVPAISKIKGVLEVTEVYGSYDIIVKVKVKKLSDLDTILNQIRSRGEIIKTTTMISNK